MGETQRPAAPNITDSYDQTRLNDTLYSANHPSTEHKLGQTSTPTAREDILSVKDAIAFSKDDDYKQRTDLSDNQKKLIAAIAEERTTSEGRHLTEEAVNVKDSNGHDTWLVYQTRPNISGEYSPYSNVIIVSSDSWTTGPSSDVSQRMIHHEFVHKDQDINKAMPEGLSSYDQVLWTAGMEGQAYVAEEDEHRRRVGEPPLTDEKKREIFANSISANNYVERYKLNERSRSDGRHLTPKEFNEAYGTVPGHPEDGNFLDSGHLKDPADAFNGTVPVNASTSAIPPESKGVKYEDLPAASNGMARIESKNKDYIIYVTQKENGENADVEVYRRVNTQDGAGYVDIAHRTIKTDENNQSGLVNIIDPDHPNVHIAVYSGKDGIAGARSTIEMSGDLQPSMPDPQNYKYYDTPIPGTQHLQKLEDLPKTDRHTIRVYDREMHEVVYFTEDPKTHAMHISKAYDYQNFPAANMAGYRPAESFSYDSSQEIPRASFDRDIKNNPRYAPIDKHGKITPQAGSEAQPATKDSAQDAQAGMTQIPQSHLIAESTTRDMGSYNGRSAGNYRNMSGDTPLLNMPASTPIIANTAMTPAMQSTVDTRESLISIGSTILHNGFQAEGMPQALSQVTIAMNTVSQQNARQPMSETLPDIKLTDVNTSKIDISALPASKLGRISL